MASEISELDSVWNVLGLSSTNPLDTFLDMWYQMLLWALFSSVLVHVVAAGMAFKALRRHKTARYLSLAILTAGFVTPITSSIITSAAIAGVYRAASFRLVPLHALFWGVGQTLFSLFFAFSRILATL